MLLLFYQAKSFAQGSVTYKYDNLQRLIELNYDSVIIKYFYDEVSNRTSSLSNSPTICPGRSTFFYAGAHEAGNFYQWQIDSGSGFINLSNDIVYSGVTTNTVTLSSPPNTLYGNKYRCVITNGTDTTITDPVILRFAVTWFGKFNSSWEAAGNWSCGRIPDENTDVIISPGTVNFPTVNSNAVCRSLNVNPSASIKIATGYSLTIIGK